MGITIHYKGKAKSLEAIDNLIEELKEIAEKFNWEYWIVDKPLKGKLSPSWGYGYSYVPTEDEIKKDGIEFFPKMVSDTCTGYYMIGDSKYADEARKALRKGKYPEFSIDTNVKGICLNVHPECETLAFEFDLKTLELVKYRQYNHSPGIIYGYDSLFCKTQFAGFKIHQLICKLIKLTEKYIDYEEIYDEAEYYHNQDEEAAQKAFCENEIRIEQLAGELDEVFGEGNVIRGYEL